jgi:hypothetical protein
MGARKTAREQARAAGITAEVELFELELCQLTDDVIDGYVAWRDQSAAATYADWQEAGGGDAAAFDAYMTALDYEEEAAAQYEGLLELMARRLTG